MQKTVTKCISDNYHPYTATGKHSFVFPIKKVVSPTNKLRSRILFLLVFFPLLTVSAQISLKTNLLYDATLTPNLGVEWFATRHSSLQFSYGYHPWTFGEGHKLRNWTVSTAYRYWWTQTGTGHFTGIQLQGGQYNLGGIRLPFWQGLADRRYEGWLAGAGLTYGYSLPLSGRWRVEAVLGIGYDYLHYKAFACPTCREVSAHKVKQYIGPNQLALNLAYRF